MKDKKIFFILAGVQMLMLININLTSFAFNGIGEYSPEELKKLNEEDEKWNVWLKKYIKEVLYVGMPEDEFVKIFTKDDLWSDPERPYIIKHISGSYYLIGRKGMRYKVTFKNGVLGELAQRTWEKIPIITTHYKDFTHLLREYKYTEGLYKGMPEDEFLKKFFHKVISKFERDNENGYILLLKHGNRLEVCFENKILTNVSWEEKHTYETIDELMTE